MIQKKYIDDRHRQQQTFLNSVALWNIHFLLKIKVITFFDCVFQHIKTRKRIIRNFCKFSLVE
jgi:hypothetical protein